MGYCNSKVAKEIKQSGFCYPRNPVLASTTFLVGLAVLGVVIYEFHQMPSMQGEWDLVLIRWLFVLDYANTVGTGKKSHINIHREN